jgi:superfamily II DNA or RNA helicase
LKEFIPRPYQAECLAAIAAQPPGHYLCRLATGLGKTAIFTHVPRQGKLLILSHREELVHQPLQWFAPGVAGVEQGAEHAGPEYEVVSASIQSMGRRMEKYPPGTFDVVVMDEAHHAAAKNYRKVLEHFTPRLLLGFTATPQRGDHARLDDIFEDILFDRDLEWGIRNGYLSDIDCKRAVIGFDLSQVGTRHGDYDEKQLAAAMEGTAHAIADAYERLHHGATLIFAVNIKQCEQIAAAIPGAVVVTGKTPNRAAIIQRFTEGEIPCLVNCMVFTEGTDIPRVETVILARPTRSDALYTQMVGRGLRPYPGKERLTLIDCVGVSETADLCTAASLLGLDTAQVPGRKQQELEGTLFEVADKVHALADTPEAWIKEVHSVNLFAKAHKVNTRGVHYLQLPDGSLRCVLKGHKAVTVPAPDELGRIRCKDGSTMPLQQALDVAYQFLVTNCMGERYLWDEAAVKRWEQTPASDKQLHYARQLCAAAGYDFPHGELTKAQCGAIITRLA